MFAIKIILLFLFCPSVFAYSFPDCPPPSEKERSKLDNFYKNLHVYEREDFLASCDDTLNVKEREVHPRGCGIINHIKPADDEILKHEHTGIYTNDDGTKETTKRITCKKNREIIVTIHDKKDNLLFSKHYKWNGSMLIQTIDDGVVRNIIIGKTRCNFTIIEPSGDSVSFNLHPKKKLDPSIKIRGDFQFSNYMRGDDRKQEIEIGKYDAIIYQWHSFCKGSHEFEAPNSHLEQENEFDVTDNDVSLSYTSPYKYYAIISICIIAASIVAIRKKWRMKK
jgi:hypothetical protein